MNYVDTINGYVIYEVSKKTCKEHGYCFPTFAAFLGEEIKLGYEEWTTATFGELAEWCEDN